ncbi:hypothetical protein CPB84DRAFT_1853557 [Gymnopilus junonius]|uniref:Uncharacterized protein n=1 Tax=Gymnopilus junonius TaxID=109634 RepID=A0A9P5TH69_GYMJU|nr:hypothetical protein CPB84DRAFT_1853557 [Gymnopilus junonius]
MAPRKRTLDSGSDYDSDAPEAVPLSQSKKEIQKLETSRQNALLAERQSKKTQNREKDRKLKERAEVNRTLGRKGKEKAEEKGKKKDEMDEEEEDSDGANELEARMLRAMKEANDEDEGSDDDEDVKGLGSIGQDGEEEEDELEDGSEEDELDEDDEEDDTEEDGDGFSGSGSEEEDLPPPSSSKKAKTSTRLNPDHLPDELFAAAFASQSRNKRALRDDSEPASKGNRKDKARPAKKRKTNPKSPKDLVVGSRSIRVLPSSTNPPTPSTLPSRKINKFLDRTLALKGGKQRAKGWERRPVNLGVLRSAAGPAVNFVRG